MNYYTSYNELNNYLWINLFYFNFMYYLYVIKYNPMNHNQKYILMGYVSSFNFKY